MVTLEELFDTYISKYLMADVITRRDPNHNPNYAINYENDYELPDSDPSDDDHHIRQDVYREDSDIDGESDDEWEDYDEWADDDAYGIMLMAAVFLSGTCLGRL